MKSKKETLSLIFFATNYLCEIYDNRVVRVQFVNLNQVIVFI